MNSSPSLLRKAEHAGSWYSSDPAKLDVELSKYLTQAELFESEKTLKALIGPHAGFRYSGPTAAWAYK
jgi:AmmeMemoRadiSam system protein B